MSLQDIINQRTNSTWSADEEIARANEYAKMYSDALDIQYAAGIQNLTEQKQNLPAAYDPYRAGVNAQFERSMRTNNEQMANLGLNRSGTNLTNQIRLSNERARGMAEVDSNQAKAEQEIKAQINEYIAQRDSAKAQQKAEAFQNAYNNISSHQRTLAQMEQQNKYDIQLAELDYAHDEEMARLNHQYAIAEMNNDYAKKAQLEKEMAALDYSYSMQKIERQQQLENESYAQRAATDWGYTQQQMALDSKLSLDEYKAKAATDWGYKQKQLALENQYDMSLASAKNVASAEKEKTKLSAKLSNNAKILMSVIDSHGGASSASYAKSILDKAINDGHITDTEYINLINFYDL